MKKTHWIAVMIAMGAVMAACAWTTGRALAEAEAAERWAATVEVEAQQWLAKMADEK